METPLPIPLHARYAAKARRLVIIVMITMITIIDAIIAFFCLLLSSLLGLRSGAPVDVGTYYRAGQSIEQQPQQREPRYHHIQSDVGHPSDRASHSRQLHMHRR